MKVIVHPTECMHLPSGLEENFPKGLNKPFPIRIVLKDRLLPVAPIHDMINRSCVFDSKISGNDTKEPVC